MSKESEININWAVFICDLSAGSQEMRTVNCSFESSYMCGYEMWNSDAVVWARRGTHLHKKSPIYISSVESGKRNDTLNFELMFNPNYFLETQKISKKIRRSSGLRTSTHEICLSIFSDVEMYPQYYIYIVGLI